MRKESELIVRVIAHIVIVDVRKYYVIGQVAVTRFKSIQYAEMFFCTGFNMISQKQRIAELIFFEQVPESHRIGLYGS